METTLWCRCKEKFLQCLQDGICQCKPDLQRYSVLHCEWSIFAINGPFIGNGLPLPFHLGLFELHKPYFPFCNALLQMKKKRKYYYSKNTGILFLLMNQFTFKCAERISILVHISLCFQVHTQELCAYTPKLGKESSLFESIFWQEIKIETRRCGRCLLVNLIFNTGRKIGSPIHWNNQMLQVPSAACLTVWILPFLSGHLGKKGDLACRSINRL